MRLVVRATLHHAYVPGIAQTRLAGSWLDPLAGGQALSLTNDTTRAGAALPGSLLRRHLHHTERLGQWAGAVGGSDEPQSFTPPSECLKTAAPPNNAIYVLAMDWRPELGGQIYAHQPDADTYAITWFDVRRVGGIEPQSFQVVFQRNGEVSAFYRSVTPATPAIIGTENWDGTVAHQVLCGDVGQPVTTGIPCDFDTRLPW